MARTRPTIEPTALRAGETWDWERSLGDYPAGDWTLSYILTNASAKLTLTASAEGATHVIDVAPATTATYTAGRYDWQARVTDGVDVYTVGTGALTVLPNLAAVGVTAYDGRTHARIMYDALTALLESRATDADIDVVTTTLGDRSITRHPDRLIQLRSQYAQAVRREEDAARIARGEGIGRLFQVRFRA